MSENLNHQIGFTYTYPHTHKERKCSFREYDRTVIQLKYLFLCLYFC